MKTMPFPSNDGDELSQQPVASNTNCLPWKKLHPNEAIPMCFEVRLADGIIESFAYSDFRGAKLLHAGHLIVRVFGMEKYHIIVTGRHLGELAKHLSLGRIHWFGETAHGETETAESCPHIASVQIDALTGP